MRTLLYVLTGFVLGIAYMCVVYAYIGRRTEKRLAREFASG